MSLSGYEELAEENEETTTAEETTLDETTSDYNNTTNAEETAEQSGYQDEHQEQRNMPDDSLLDEAEMTGSTPRVPTSKSLHVKPQFAEFESPYEKLRRELKGDTTIFKDDERFAEGDDDETMELPGELLGHPNRTFTKTRLPDMSMTPRSSSLLEEPGPQSTARKNKDPLLHRLLDKNYRVQATPHKNVVPILRARGRSPVKVGEGEEDRTRRALWQDSPMSSPEMAVPKLRSDLYMSPVRLRQNRAGAASGAPRTPGVSVQTPTTLRKTRDIFAEAKGKGLSTNKKPKDEITWDSDDDDDFGAMSPPKTIQFVLPPSKLMQTPGK